MDLQILMPWVVAASTLLSFGTAVYTLLSAGAKKTAADLEAYKASQGKNLADIEEALDGHDRRIQALESEVKHLPNRAMFHDLQLTLKDIQIEMAAIKAATEQATRTGRRVEDYLIRKGEVTA